MKIERIWEELENDESLYSGLLYKRFSAFVKPNVFIAVKAPEGLRCIAISVRADTDIDLFKFNYLKDIKIEFFPDENDRSKKFLLILLLNNQHKDIFSTLCMDLINRVTEVSVESILIEKLLERISKWQSLFEKLGLQGLTNEAQRGLFGEVYFLRRFILKSSNAINCVEVWTGSEKSIQDFQYSDWAVEVKTTHGKNHQKIHITSERQLDNSIIPNIFLYHLSLDIRNGNGETLNHLIESVFEVLEDKIAATNILKLKLMEAGYFDIHKPLYRDRGYNIRKENIYFITEDFPKITEQQIPKGVGDVRYSIVLTDSEAWRIDETQLMNKIVDK